MQQDRPPGGPPVGGAPMQRGCSAAAAGAMQQRQAAWLHVEGFGQGGLHGLLTWRALTPTAACVCRSYAKGFSAVGALFAGSECVIEKVLPRVHLRACPTCFRVSTLPYDPPPPQGLFDHVQRDGQRARPLRCCAPSSRMLRGWPAAAESCMQLCPAAQRPQRPPRQATAAPPHHAPVAPNAPAAAALTAPRAAQVRAKHDIYNSVYAGCAAGAVLAHSAGPKGMCLGCASFAAFSAVIDKIMEHD
jgi:hypothetical protein